MLEGEDDAMIGVSDTEIVDGTGVLEDVTIGEVVSVVDEVDVDKILVVGLTALVDSVGHQLLPDAQGDDELMRPYGE